MTEWKNKLDLTHIFHNEHLSFDERKVAIVALIRSSSWYKELRKSDHNAWYIYDIVDDLEDTKNAEDFDCVWSSFYDWADSNRLWVAT